MPTPSSALTTLRPDLGASLEEFDLQADREGFIGHRVFPVLDVGIQSGTFGKIPAEALLRAPETKRRPRSTYARTDWEFEEDSFATKENGIEEMVDCKEVKLYANFFDAEMMAVKRARDIILRNAEQRVADAVFNATTFTPTTITDEWDDFANAVPLDDVETAVKALWDNCGMWANALIINRHVFRNLRRCTQIHDLLKYNGHTDVKASAITASILAEVFDIDQVLVAGGAKNTANYGQGSATFGKIWSDEYAMVARICTTDDIVEPGLGRTFHWPGDGSDIDGTVEQYESPERRGEVYRVRHETQEKMLMTVCGQLLDNVTT